MEIWLIDDDPLTNMLNRMLINDFDKSLNVREFEKAEDALDRLLAGQNPDVIFLDINMPVMNGWDFISELEKRPGALSGKTKIHMLTSSVAPNDKSFADASPIVELFLIKPLTPEILREIL